MFLPKCSLLPYGPKPTSFRNTGSKERIWQSDKEKYYESVIALMSDQEKGDLCLDQLKILTSKESKTENTQYYILSWPDKQACQITNFPNPYPQLDIAERDDQVSEKRWGSNDCNTIPAPRL